MGLYSEGFLLLLPLLWLAKAAAGPKYGWVVLLLASLGFYGLLVGPSVFAALAFVTLVAYSTGLAMAGPLGRSEQARKVTFRVGVAVILGVLVWARYSNFLAIEVNGGLALLGLPARAALPPILVAVGVSFHVFTALSYMADVYLERFGVERHFGRFCLYLYYLPKVIQGPIERAASLLPQLTRPRPVVADDLARGMMLFGLGLAKKAIVADRLRVLVDAVYSAPTGFSGWPLVAATLAYALQIYFDFSGYTDMARGVSRTLGIELARNFDRPYFAQSIPDFWRRWHISLSTWIGDYLFKPLQMRLRYWGDWGNAVALLVAFSLCGLWHGPGWCFLIWGALHGLYMAVSTLCRRRQKALYRRLGIEKARAKVAIHTVATLALVSFAWIFFRSASLSEAWYIVTHLAAPTVGQIGELAPVPATALALATAALFLALESYSLDSDGLIRAAWSRPLAARWLLVYAVVLGLFFLGSSETSRFSFIYAQF